MEFIVPFTESPQQAEKVYNEIKSCLESDMVKLSSDRIYSIVYWKGKNRKSATVGYKFWETGEIVLAIFLDPARKLYSIVTPNYGYLRNAPAQVGTLHRVDVTYFEGY